MAPDHGDRRRLARDAAAEGWTVRETEARAREAAGGGRRGRRRGSTPAHPDQLAAAERLGDALGAALGAEVRVTPRGEGYRVTIGLESLDDAIALAERLGAGAPAL